MKQIMADVLKAEERVGAILKQAREKASQINQSVEKEIAEQISEARRKAHEISQTTIENARQEAQRVKQEKLKESQQQQRAQLNDNKGKMDRLVDDICQLILKAEHPKGDQ